MATLLTTNAAAVLSHVLINILVANGSLGITNSLLVKCLVQTKVGHDSSNNGIIQQFATLFHVATVDIKNMVASNDITLLVHTQTAVSVTVIGKTNIQPFLYNELLETLNMRRTGICVDVRAVWLVVYSMGVCAQSIENTLSDVPRTAVSAVQTNLDSLEGIDAQGDQVAHVTVAACHIVHSATDMLTMRKRQFWPVLVEHMELAIDVVLYQQQCLFRHLLAVAVDQLDAVVVIRVVTGRDHNATVKIIHTSNISHGRSSGDMKQISVCARSRQTSHQTITYRSCGAYPYQ